MDQGRESVRVLCEIAARRGVMVDMHCDESDDPHSRHIETAGLRDPAPGSAWPGHGLAPDQHALHGQLLRFQLPQTSFGHDGRSLETLWVSMEVLLVRCSRDPAMQTRTLGQGLDVAGIRVVGFVAVHVRHRTAPGRDFARRPIPDDPWSLSKGAGCHRPRHALVKARSSNSTRRSAQHRLGKATNWISTKILHFLPHFQTSTCIGRVRGVHDLSSWCLGHAPAPLVSFLIASAEFAPTRSVPFPAGCRIRFAP